MCGTFAFRLERVHKQQRTRGEAGDRLFEMDRGTRVLSWMEFGSAFASLVRLTSTQTSLSDFGSVKP